MKALKNVLAGVTVGLVALMMTVSVASANSGLLALLTGLGLSDAQAAAVMGAIEGSTPAATASAYTHAGTLRRGSTGSQVMDLQECLNSLGYNAGQADGVFGGGTQAAVMAFQSAEGLGADGIVGAMSGAALEAACVAEPVVVVIEDPVEEPEVEPASAFDSNSGNEVNFKDFDVDDASDDTIQEGADMAELATIEFENEDSDVLLERFDVLLDYRGGESADEDDAWKAFNKFYLMVDGEEIASMDADDESDWDDRTVSTITFDDTENRLRISGIDHVFEEGVDHDLVLAADIAGSLDLGTDSEALWHVFVDESSLRFVDEAGITQYLSPANNSADFAAFTIQEDGADDKLTIRESSDDPDSQAMQVEDNQTSDWFDIFAFELDVDDDSGELTFKDIYLELTSGTADVDDIINDLELVVDGNTYTDWTLSGSGTTQEVHFDVDDEDFVLDTDAREEAVLRAEFKAANGTAAVAAVAQVDTVTVDTGVNATTYSVSIGGNLYTITSADNVPANIATQIAAAVTADSAVSATASGADVVITAASAGTAFTTQAYGANMSLVNSTANAAATTASGNYEQGETIYAEITAAKADTWNVDGGDDLTASQITGSATGETHTLLVDGALVTLNNVTETALSSSNTSQSDVLSATFSVNVEAFDEPIYIPVAAANALNEDIYDATTDAAAANVTLSSDYTITLSSSATRVATTDSSNYYKVSSDEDITITFTSIAGQDVASGDFYALISGLKFTTLDVASGTNATAVASLDTITLDDDEFRSGVVTLLN